MDYRIVERLAFSITGKTFRVSTKNGDNYRRIPQFWQESYTDGTVALLRALRQDGVLLGVCMDMDDVNEEFTYAIAVEGNFSNFVNPLSENHFDVVEVRASTWAVFTSTGALPGAIQRVWEQIYEEWLPSVNYRRSGAPEIEVLPPGDDCADSYQCEVWIPIVNA